MLIKRNTGDEEKLQEDCEKTAGTSSSYSTAVLFLSNCCNICGTAYRFSLNHFDVMHWDFCLI